MGININKHTVMLKEVSALNTYWLLQYLQEHHPSLDQEKLISRIAELFPCYIQNLKTGRIEPICLSHLQNPRYWFSHRFVKTLHDLIEEQIPDPRLGYKIGSTMYKTQPILRTALGVPLLGLKKVAYKISLEAAKYNRTKQYFIKKVEKGLIEIRIIHNPGIVISEFTMQWNAGCFHSYGRLAGAKDITVHLHCVDPGPESSEDTRRAIWDFEIRYNEPFLLRRLAKAFLFNLPWIRTLAERAEAIESEHQDQIFNRDAIIDERTAALVKANEAMRMEIAERQQVEQALLRSQGMLQRYVSAIDDIGLGLCVINGDYRLRSMNKTMHHWFGGQPGDSCFKTLFGKDTPCHHCRLQDVVAQSKTVRYQPSMDDGRSFEIVATPITNEDGTVSKMIMIRNITEQQQQERQRLETSRQKEQLKKLSSLKNMAGAIAHRFNNAMVGVQGNLELLTMFLPDSSKEHKMASNAFQAAKGASQVGSMMLSYVGQRPLTARRESLADITREVINAANDILYQGVDINLVPPSNPLFCSIDQQQIKEVVEKILTNAVESLENGPGTIEITFGEGDFTVSDFPIFFHDSNLKDGRYSFCQIQDSGHGVSSEDLPKVFEPFYTTRFIGRGLGLALSVGIMQAHHGAISFDSQTGHGTTVRILLPSLDYPVQQATPHPYEPEKPVIQICGDILLVDDESIVLSVGKEILTMLGFRVDTAMNGKEAVAKVGESGKQYRLIIMDISMPGISGIEAMKTIRTMSPTIPIILTSGYSESDFRFDKDHGSKPDGFLAKPFNVQYLQRIVGELLSSN